MLRLLCCQPKTKDKKKGILSFFKHSNITLDRFDGAAGPIEIYTIYNTSQKARQKMLDLLSKELKDKIFTAQSEVPDEYITRLKLNYANRLLKQGSFTISVPDNLETEDLISLCRNAKTLYIIGKEKEETVNLLYNACGVVPQFVSDVFNADIIFSLIKPEYTLPPTLKSIIPPDFSPALFMGLIYKHNGIFFG